ncbi:unnamed protein product [Lasius platythorax]|uniref:Uncharacterized protein n=1 Tax=Lasius platythorax TaxID=488582 RepID=A0AAV2P6B1_9HYME
MPERGRRKRSLRRHRKERNVETARPDNESVAKVEKREGRKGEEVKDNGAGQRRKPPLLQSTAAMDSQMDTSPTSPLSVHFALLLVAKRAAQIKRLSLKRNSRIFNTHAAP